MQTRMTELFGIKYPVMCGGYDVVVQAGAVRCSLQCGCVG